MASDLTPLHIWRPYDRNNSDRGWKSNYVETSENHTWAQADIICKFLTPHAEYLAHIQKAAVA